MKNEKHSAANSTADLIWQNFCETGEIGYYLLYKQVSEKQNIADKRKLKNGIHKNKSDSVKSR